jgi:RNA polymerase sigma factor (sigma-70 family)
LTDSARYDQGDSRDERLLEQIRETLERSDPLSLAARQALLAELLAPYEPVIRGLVAADLWRLGREEVDDWTQETWRRLVEEILSGKRWPFTLRQVVIARARFTCRDARRALVPRGRREIPTELEPEDERVDTEELALGQVTLDRFLGLLSPEDRTVVERSWLEGRTSAVLAEELGTTVGAIEQRKHRIRKRLREYLNA